MKFAKIFCSDASLTNTYYRREVPGVVGVSGRADASAPVAVNGQAAYRRYEYFWKEITVANSSAAIWQPLTVVANVSGQSPLTTTGNRFVPRTPESFTYDSDGNLTQDGHWTYIWDAENRLIGMTSLGVGHPQSLAFEYDAQGRRIRKKVWDNGSLVLDNKCLYDGWNLMAELDARNSDAVLRTYVWGQDLSGSLQGAGGVGGLLAVKSSSVYHFACYDGNGNLVALVNGSTGVASANYDYGPFGEVVRQTGPMAKHNPFRFSAKYTDEETELVYYGYRYYSPTLGRWLSRDPIQENGGLNLYGFVVNNPTRFVDPFGKNYVPWDGWPLYYNKESGVWPL